MIQRLLSQIDRLEREAADVLDGASRINEQLDICAQRTCRV